MRTRFPILLLLAAIFAVPVAHATARSGKPALNTCGDLARERGLLIRESKLATSNVEAKNTELGEAADALKAAKDDARKTELQRRVEGLRRELATLEDKETSTVNRLGALDSEIAKKGCKSSGELR